MSEGGDTFKVTIKVSTGTKCDVTLRGSMTVQEAKEAAAEPCGVPPDRQRLIYRGRILKAGDKISDYGISNGHTIHMVKGGGAAPSSSATAGGSASASAGEDGGGAAPTATTTTAPGGADASGSAGGQPRNMPDLAALFGGAGVGPPNGFPDPAMMLNMLQNPAMQQFMRQTVQQPEFLRTLIQANPMLSSMVQSNPMISQMLENPEVLRSMFDPQVLGEMINLQSNFRPGTPGTAGGNDDAAAGGEGGAAAGTAAGESGDTATAAAGGAGGATDARSALLSLLGNEAGGGGTGAGAGGAGAGGAGNGGMFRLLEQDPNMMRMMETFTQQLMGGNDNNLASMMESLGRGGATAQMNTEEVEQRFSRELVQLQEMGFIDKDANIIALQRSGGDVNAAIAWLLESGYGSGA